jgi:hypothetical protein
MDQSDINSHHFCDAVSKRETVYLEKKGKIKEPKHSDTTSLNKELRIIIFSAILQRKGSDVSPSLCVQSVTEEIYVYLGRTPRLEKKPRDNFPSSEIHIGVS